MEVRKTEIYRRLVADQVCFYLAQQFVHAPALAADDLARRLQQARALMRPQDFDDIAINRASLGFCGWAACAAAAPQSRCLELLYMIWKTDLDPDVIDSFHSLDCFKQFLAVRKQLSPTLTQLRRVPDDLAAEFVENKLPSSNIQKVLTDVEARQLLASQGAAGAAKLGDEDHDGAAVRSHPAKCTDAVGAADQDWKRVPKEQVAQMAQLSAQDISRFDYEAASAQKTCRSKPAAALTEGLEYFASMADLLNCSFDDDDAEEDHTENQSPRSADSDAAAE